MMWTPKLLWAIEKRLKHVYQWPQFTHINICMPLLDANFHAGSFSYNLQSVLFISKYKHSLISFTCKHTSWSSDFFWNLWRWQLLYYVMKLSIESRLPIDYFQGSLSGVNYLAQDKEPYTASLWKYIMCCCGLFNTALKRICYALY